MKSTIGIFVLPKIFQTSIDANVITFYNLVFKSIFCYRINFLSVVFKHHNDGTVILCCYFINNLLPVFIPLRLIFKFLFYVISVVFFSFIQIIITHVSFLPELHFTTTTNDESTIKRTRSSIEFVSFISNHFQPNILFYGI